MPQTLINELKTLLIEGLHLDEVSADEIDIEQPLFGDGLGLDSIDALEIAVLLDRQYGIKITSEDDKNRQIFASLSALAKYVADNRSK